MEIGETETEALQREIGEELNAEIHVINKLTTVDYDYPAFHLTMHCFVCRLLNENLQLLEHEAARWLSLQEIDSVRWLPADVVCCERLKEAMPLSC